MSVLVGQIRFDLTGLDSVSEQRARDPVDNLFLNVYSLDFFMIYSEASIGISLE
jgi:hypothetical protein